MAAAQEEAAETEQAEIVTAEPQEGDTVVIVYEGNEIEATFRNIAGPEFPVESQGDYVYDVLGMSCCFKQAVAPGRIDYEKLPEEWQSMARTVYMINKQESEQDDDCYSRRWQRNYSYIPGHGRRPICLRRGRKQSDNQRSSGKGSDSL